MQYVRARNQERVTPAKGLVEKPGCNDYYARSGCVAAFVIQRDTDAYSWESQGTQPLRALEMTFFNKPENGNPEKTIKCTRFPLRGNDTRGRE